MEAQLVGYVTEIAIVVEGQLSKFLSPRKILTCCMRSGKSIAMVSNSSSKGPKTFSHLIRLCKRQQAIITRLCVHTR